MMEYEGKYELFDVEKIKTYSLDERSSQLTLENMIELNEIIKGPMFYDSPELRDVADSIIKARQQSKPVILFSGAHLIKNGLSPILNDLIKKNIVTCIGTNGAFSIHDFELAFSGKTSENVPNALKEGKFGFAEETNRYINLALIHGNKLKLGYGEAVGRLIDGQPFPQSLTFKYPEISVLYNAYKNDIPCCVHCAIGGDIYQMTKYFDGEALGGCSGRDFWIFAKEISKLENGGVVLLIGSPVIGVEAILKSFSMSANIGNSPKAHSLTTAVFDIREANIEDVKKNRKDKPSYYFRDIKSIVIRIPESFNGKGYYIKGEFEKTIPSLYKLIINKMR